MIFSYYEFTTGDLSQLQKMMLSLLRQQDSTYLSYGRELRAGSKNVVVGLLKYGQHMALK